MRIVIEGDTNTGLRVDTKECDEDFILLAVHSLTGILVDTMTLKNYQQENMRKANYYG